MLWCHYSNKVMQLQYCKFLKATSVSMTSKFGVPYNARKILITLLLVANLKNPF